MPSRGERCPFNQPLRLEPADEPLWPILPRQQPVIARSVDEFMDAVLFQQTVDRVVVLKDGVRLLGQQDAMPAALCTAVRNSTTMRECLKAMPEDAQDAFKARLWHYGTRGAEKEVREKGDKTRTVREVAGILRDQEHDGSCPRDAPLYISELRWKTKVDHPICKGEKVKTATNVDVYDYTPVAKKLPLWERSEGGIFVGERGTGSGLHVDQCLWSNVGRQWCGYKLFAVWPWTERHAILDDVGKGKIFHLPLKKEEEAFLRRAKTIALVGPGDAFLFSGGQPHMALGVGDGLCLTAYESLVAANHESVSLLAKTNTASAHWKKCWMDDDDLDDLYEDVVDALQDALEDPSTGPDLRRRLIECVAAMRRDGDDFVNRLWAIEDRRAKRASGCRRCQLNQPNQPEVRSRAEDGAAAGAAPSAKHPRLQ